jgi:hypothetical protein
LPGEVGGEEKRGVEPALLLVDVIKDLERRRRPARRRDRRPQAPLLRLRRDAARLAARDSRCRSSPRVFQTATDALRLGLEVEVEVQADACATVDEEHEALALAYLEEVVGVTVNGRSP